MNAHAMYNDVELVSDNDLITKHAKLVKRIAFHLMHRLPPNVQAEDLIPVSYTHLTLPTIYSV